jgi:ketosteroid isomerase-like protein
MEPSTELQELYVRICQAQTDGDYPFFERCFSQQDGVVAVGTDPTEWWSGYATIAKVFKAQLQETGGFELLAGTPEARCEGSVGWVAGHPTLRLADGTEMPLRLTLVFHKEQGEWKIVHWHSSLGIANEDAIGETLTTE